jgi:chaperonin GroES
MGLKPLHDWVLIRRDEPEEITAGGIIIPASARSEPSRGVVEAIGPGRYKKDRGKKEERFVPTVLKPGQWVFFPEYAARDAELDGGKVTLIREEDILGTFEGRSKPAGEKHQQTERRKEGPPAEKNAARAPENVRKKKTAVRTKPGKAAKPRKAVKQTTVPKKKTKTASPKDKGEKKLKAEKTVSARKTPKKTPKKTAKKVKKTTPKKPTAKKAASKKTVRKKTALKRIVPKKKTPRKR